MRGTQRQTLRSLPALSGTLLGLAVVAGCSPHKRVCLGAKTLCGVSLHRLPRGCPSLSAGSGWGWGVHTPVRCHIRALPGKHPHRPPAPGSQPREPADRGGCDPPDPSPCLSPVPLAWSRPVTSTLKAHKPIKPSMLTGCDSSFCYLAFSY